MPRSDDPDVRKAQAAARRAERAKGRQSLAAHYAARHEETARAVERAVRRAVPRLAELAPEEDLYAFAIYTSGTSLFSYAMISACTEQGLDRAAQAYLERDPSSTLERQRRSLRWSAPDWPHHAFAEVTDLQLSPASLRHRAEDAAIWEAFAQALERCDGDGLFGTGEAREAVTLAILCGDMDGRFFGKAVKRLNPPRVAARAQREWRAQHRA